jgi:hypothetical protein
MHYERKVDEYRKAAADHAGALAAANVWDDCNPDDGVGCVSSNPYNPDRAGVRELDARTAMEKAQHAYQLTIDTFLDEDDES